MSAFGVDLGSISKADQEPVSAGRVVAGAVFPGAHAAVAGKKGHKLRAAGWEVGGTAVAPGLGGAVGTVVAQKHGHYKKQKVAKADRKTDALMGGATAGAAGSVALTRSGSKDLIRSARPGKQVAVRKLPTPLKVKGARKGAVGLALGAASLGAAEVGSRRARPQSYMSKSAFGPDLGHR